MSDDDLEPVAYEGESRDMLTHAKWGHPDNRMDIPEEVDTGNWRPLFTAEQFLDILRDVQQERCDCGLDIELCDTCEAIEDVRERVESAETSGEGDAT